MADARWSSAGILPEAASDRAAHIVVFAARTAGWRGIFAVHTWIVMKPPVRIPTPATK